MIRVFMIGYSENKGGVERYIGNLSSSLPASEFEIIYSMPEMRIDGKLWKRPMNRHRFFSYAAFWKRFYKETKIDVLYFNTCDVVSIDMLRFAKKAGIPIRIIHSHNSGIQQAIGAKLSFFHRLSEQYNRKVLDQYATHFFACSRVAGDWMFDGRPYTVIKNGIRISQHTFSKEKREKIRASLGLKDELLVGIVGRISSQKNPLFSVNILNALIRKVSTAHAVFLGDGELRQQTEKAVNDVELQNSVHFIGNVDNVNEWMSAFDVLLIPSLFEGLPFVLIEAQAAGLPCVASAAISHEADISGKVRFVSLNDPLSIWSDAVLSAANSPRYDAMKELIAAGYSIDDCAESVADLIKKAVGEGGTK